MIHEVWEFDQNAVFSKKVMEPKNIKCASSSVAVGRPSKGDLKACCQSKLLTSWILTRVADAMSLENDVLTRLP